MKDFIIIAGAPGVGKTTVSELLQKELNSPLIDFGTLRTFHLDEQWSDQSMNEETLTFENLIFILKNYHKHGYRNVIVNDLREDKVIALSHDLEDFKYVVITLTIADDEELRRRISRSRDSGWKNAEKAIEWNRRVSLAPLLPHEHRVDNTHSDPSKVVNEILGLLKK